jgi:hypothetical protein
MKSLAVLREGAAADLAGLVVRRWTPGSFDDKTQA